MIQAFFIKLLGKEIATILGIILGFMLILVLIALFYETFIY